MVESNNDSSSNSSNSNSGEDGFNEDRHGIGGHGGVILIVVCSSSGIPEPQSSAPRDP